MVQYEKDRLKQRNVFCNMRIQSEKYVVEYIINALFDLMKKKKYDDISITEITNSHITLSL